MLQRYFNKLNRQQIRFSFQIKQTSLGITLFGKNFVMTYIRIETLKSLRLFYNEISPILCLEVIYYLAGVIFIHVISNFFSKILSLVLHSHFFFLVLLFRDPRAKAIK